MPNDSTPNDSKTARDDARGIYSPRVLAPLLVFAALTFYLGTGPSAIGPADWDDALYCDYAVTGASHFELRNRYVHVWGIRLADSLTATRRAGASLYSSGVTVAIGWLAFFLARRLAGTAAGLCALAFTLLFPPILHYVSTPHVDPTMTLWVLAAILASVIAIENPASPRASLPAAISGMATFLALESKESALPLLPIVIYLYLAHSQHKRLHLGSWALGLCAGWLVLLGLDLAFSQPGHPYSSTPWHYFGHRPDSDPRLGFTRVPDLRKFRQLEFGNQLSSAAYYAFTFMGLAQLARGFRDSVIVKALGLWFFGCVALTAWVSLRTWDIQVYDRYLIGPGMALVVLAGAWLAQLWSAAGERDVQSLVWLVPTLGAALGVTLPALYASRVNPADAAAARTVFFALPPTCLLLFLTPWLTRNRFLPLTSAIVLVGISGYASIMDAAQAQRSKRDELTPWNQLARLTDAANVDLAVWDAPKYPERRVLWRLRLLSHRAVNDVHVRTIAEPNQAGPSEWVFAATCRRPPRLDAAFAPVISGSCHSAEWQWTVYARRPAAAIPPTPPPTPPPSAAGVEL